MKQDKFDTVERQCPSRLYDSLSAHTAINALSQDVYTLSLTFNQLMIMELILYIIVHLIAQTIHIKRLIIMSMRALLRNGNQQVIITGVHILDLIL